MSGATAATSAAALSFAATTEIAERRVDAQRDNLGQSNRPESIDERPLRRTQPDPVTRDSVCTCIDLFCGMGTWSVAARAAQLNLLG